VLEAIEGLVPDRWANERLDEYFGKDTDDDPASES
jgi:hypothetical protein